MATTYNIGQEKKVDEIALIRDRINTDAELNRIKSEIKSVTTKEEFDSIGLAYNLRIKELLTGYPLYRDGSEVLHHDL